MLSFQTVPIQFLEKKLEIRKGVQVTGSYKQFIELKDMVEHESDEICMQSYFKFHKEYCN